MRAEDVDAEGPSRLGVDERLELRDEPVEDDADDNDEQEEEVMPALQVDGHAVVGAGEQFELTVVLAAFLAHEVTVHGDEQPDEQDDVGEQQRPDVLKRPEERHAAQVAEEQRRVAQRREAAAGVGDQEDEEDDDVGAVPAPEVRAQQRAYEQHGRAGGAHPARKKAADEQDDDVVPRRAGDGAAYVYAAGHDVEAHEQDDEGHVVADDDLGELLCRGLGSVGEQKRHEEEQRPRERDEQLVFLPPLGLHEREDGDGQQHAREGDDAPYGKCLAKFHYRVPYTEAHLRGPQSDK